MVKPEPPAAMSEPTTDGAIAAATYFLSLTDYAFESGDIAPLMAMSATACSHCAYLGEQIDLQVDGKYSTEAEPMEVLSSQSTEIRPDEWFSAWLRVAQGPVRVLDQSGAVVDEGDGGVVDFLFAISWVGDGWRVEQVDLTEVTE
ncbi:hypothetical protein ASF78_21765 [Cellulomonas sp. Leaf334]|nr:hypothetical protein ASF78_21765 [Cellulomonas sp. Leaf334]